VDGLDDPQEDIVAVEVCDGEVLTLKLGIGVEEDWGLDEADRTDASDGVLV